MQKIATIRYGAEIEYRIRITMTEDSSAKTGSSGTHHDRRKNRQNQQQKHRSGGALGVRKYRGHHLIVRADIVSDRQTGRQIAKDRNQFGDIMLCIDGDVQPAVQLLLESLGLCPDDLVFIDEIVILCQCEFSMLDCAVICYEYRSFVLCILYTSAEIGKRAVCDDLKVNGAAFRIDGLFA